MRDIEAALETTAKIYHHEKINGKINDIAGQSKNDNVDANDSFNDVIYDPINKSSHIAIDNSVNQTSNGHHRVSVPFINKLIIKSNIHESDYLEYNNRLPRTTKSLVTSFVAAMISKFIDVTQWSPATLDAIIYCSYDHLHSIDNLNNDAVLLTNDELGECVRLSDSLTCYFAILNEVNGHLLDDNTSIGVSLLTALENWGHDDIELIIRSNDTTVTLIARNGKFFIFNTASSRRDLNISQNAAYFWCFDNILEVSHHLIDFMFVTPCDDSTTISNTFTIESVAVTLEKEEIDDVIMDELCRVYNIHSNKLRSHSNFPLEIVRGNFHQGDDRFFPFSTQGKQCTANAMAAIAMSALVSMNSWTTDVIDYLLRVGNNLYEDTMIDLGIDDDHYRYLVADEVRAEILIANNVTATYTIASEHYGNLVNFNVGTKLIDCLREFTVNDTSAILTVNSLSIAIMSRLGKYYIADSHSRDEYGKACDDGMACLISFRNIELLCEFVISNLAIRHNNSNSCNVFHLTIVGNIQLNEKNNASATLNGRIPLIIFKACSEKGLTCPMPQHPRVTKKKQAKTQYETPNDPKKKV